jgi:hypothetical protein
MTEDMSSQPRKADQDAFRRMVGTRKLCTLPGGG